MPSEVSEVERSTIWGTQSLGIGRENKDGEEKQKRY
jgi:hypothetical protein